VKKRGVGESLAKEQREENKPVDLDKWVNEDRRVPVVEKRVNAGPQKTK